MTNFQSFRHRENLDGTWDSICMRCYSTAAHTHAATLLTSAESGHQCDEASWTFHEAEAPRRGFQPVSSMLRFSPMRHGQPAGLREQSVSGRRA